MQNAQLNELERRAYRSVVDDGLLDSLLGIFLLLVGLSLNEGLLENLAWGFFGASPFVWKALRKRLIEPRTGHVRLHPSRISRIKRGKRAAMAVVVFLVLAILAVILFEGRCNTSLSRAPALLFGALVGSPIAVAGYLLEMRRWIGYAAVLGMASIVVHTMGAAGRTSAFPAGGVALVVGFCLLARFLYRHPVMPNEASLDA